MARILLIDDEPGVAIIFKRYLESTEHTLLVAENGERGLALAESGAPDLVVLDVLMPGMHGFEVARLLKERAGADFLPVIVLSGMADQSSKVLAYRSGVDDFLAKPVDRFEIMARIDQLLARREVVQALAQKNAELVELQRFREELSTMVVHDLKNPLSVVVSNLDFAIECLPGADAATIESVIDALGDSRIAAQRIGRMIGNLLDLSRMETQRFELRRGAVDVSKLLGGIAQGRQAMAKVQCVRIEVAVEAGLKVSADADVLSRVVENVLDNAFRYTPRDGQISLRARTAGEKVELRVGNSGPPIPIETRALIFEKYGQAGESQRWNLGLGLFFGRLAAEAHGGRIFIEEEPELPTVFVLELPR